MQLFDEEFKQEMMQLVRRGTDDVRTDVLTLRHAVSRVDLRLRALEIDTRSMKAILRLHGDELKRVNVLLEDLNDRFAGAAELHGN